MDKSSLENDTEFFLPQQGGDREPNFAVLQHMFQQIYANQNRGPLQQERNHDKSLPSKRAPWADAPLPRIIPYVQALTIDDLDSCFALTTAAFPPVKQPNRETLEYRLETAGSYGLGLFATVEKSKLTPEIKETLITLDAALPVESTQPDRVSVLLGHIIVTKSANQTVQEVDMSFPSETDIKDGSKVGHNEYGSTICIHNFAVLPQYQKMGLGKLLMDSYLYRIQGCGVIDRVALLCQDHLVSAYGSMNFIRLGQSKVTSAGGGWIDMAHDIEHIHPGDSEFGDDDKDEDEDDEINESDYPSLRAEMS